MLNMAVVICTLLPRKYNLFGLKFINNNCSHSLQPYGLTCYDKILRQFTKYPFSNCARQRIGQPDDNGGSRPAFVVYTSHATPHTQLVAAAQTPSILKTGR